MSKTAMQLLQERLKQDQEKRGGNGGTKKKSGDNASYPFWSIPEGSNATVRFLPDGGDNPYFWVRREVIKLPFDGQVGGDYPTDGPVTVTVPCVDMFGDTCPIVAHTRPWWKQGPDKEALARKYYKKKSYLFQGFVVNSPFVEEEVPENPIRRFVVNPSIFTIIEKSLADPDFEDLPVDYTGGRDFKIAKTRQGEYANYGTSGWSFRTRSLSEAEMSAIDQHGLFDLGTFLGPRPDADGIAMIKAMFLDSVDGKPFDFESYGAFYRAYGERGGSRSGGGDPEAISSTRVEKAAASRMASSDDEPAPRSAPSRTASASSDDEPAAAPARSANAAEILARLKAKTGG